MFENNTGHKSSTMTNNPFDLGEESTSVDAPKGDVTRTEGNSSQVTAEITGRSELRDVNEHEGTGTVETAVNCTKYVKDKNTNNGIVTDRRVVRILLCLFSRKQCSENIRLDTHFRFGPIGALQEPCALRNWEHSKYEFFKEDDSKCFTYSAECTVLKCTVRGERSNWNVQSC